MAKQAGNLPKSGFFKYLKELDTFLGVHELSVRGLDTTACRIKIKQYLRSTDSFLGLTCVSFLCHQLADFKMGPDFKSWTLPINELEWGLHRGARCQWHHAVRGSGGPKPSPPREITLILHGIR